MSVQILASIRAQCNCTVKVKLTRVQTSSEQQQYLLASNHIVEMNYPISINVFALSGEDAYKVMVKLLQKASVKGNTHPLACFWPFYPGYLNFQNLLLL